MSDVDHFIKQFHTSEKIDEVFTSRCCYWFAAMLFRRFILDGATIMYDEAANYFGTKIQDKVYDITGNVTDKYKWVPWECITDSSQRERIIKESIMF